MNNNIPKIVHYCWFGNGEKPDKVKKCINSWKNKLDGYKFIEWNETNFDYEQNIYTKQAYEQQKYAFVSDVARIKALKEWGGIYLDTDVEVLKSFDSILEEGDCILGFEYENYIATSFIACIPNHALINEFVELYDELRFLDSVGNIISGTNVSKLTELLVDKGLFRNNEKQYLNDGIIVYPSDYFSPYDYSNCYYNTSDNTYCVHYFYVSWMPWQTHLKKYIKKMIVKLIGIKNMKKLRKLLRW